MTDLCIHELEPRTCAYCQSKSSFRGGRSSFGSTSPRGSSTPIEATFGSKCAACGDGIRTGDMIVKLGDWIHEECAL